MQLYIMNLMQFQNLKNDRFVVQNRKFCVEKSIKDIIKIYQINAV